MLIFTHFYSLLINMSLTSSELGLYERSNEQSPEQEIESQETPEL